MSNFAVITHRLTIEPHPNADALECARIGGYSTIVKKGQFKTGDVAAYIPDGAVLPPEIIEELQLGDHLAGPDHNRVHAIRLRGLLSQGLVYPAPDTEPGTDLTEALGIVKYVPEIPPHFQGEAREAFSNLVRYEIDDIKMHPEMFEEGEAVIFTEKIHGTWCCIGTMNGDPLVTSKQLSAQGLAFETAKGHNDDNVYVECYRQNAGNLEAIKDRLKVNNLLVMGEIFGKEIQDLGYNRDKAEFRVFDVYTGSRDNGKFLDHAEMETAVKGLFRTVPVLYHGPFSEWVMLEHNHGKSLLAGHGREGLVIRPAKERGHPTLDRVIAKSLSERHLARKGGTEYN